MKRIAAAVAVLAMFAGAIAISSGGAGAQVGDPPEVVDQYWVDVPAGVTSFRIGYATPETDVYQVFFTPRKALAFGFKEVRPGTGWLRFTKPTESAVRIDYSVIRYSP